MIRDKHALKAYKIELFSHKTPAEQFFEKALRRKFTGKGGALKTQYVIGFYIVDFYYRSKALIIELDGEVHDQPEQRERDRKRDLFFESKGFTVLRFKNSDVYDDLEGCFRKIKGVSRIRRSDRSQCLRRAHWARKMALKTREGRKDWKQG